MPVSVADVAYPEFSLLGQSSAIREARAHIARLAKSSVSVVIYGESGTGKELAARDIHALSARSQHPFITVNCGAIPDNLMESEFFGARRGAFTGAVEDRSGFFHAAHGGTLFLDEVAELPVAMQVKLLRQILTQLHWLWMLLLQTMFPITILLQFLWSQELALVKLQQSLLTIQQQKLL